MAVSFNGTDQGLSIGGARNQFRNTAAATICLWAKLTSLPPGNRTLVKFSTGTSATSNRAEITVTASLTFRVGTKILDTDIGSLNSFGTTPAIAVGDWRHYAVVWNYSIKTFYAYLDGVLQNTTILSAANETAGNTSDTASLSASIGCADPPTGAQFFPGVIDDVVTFNRLLGPAEIQEIYASRGRAFILDGITGHWQLAEGGEGVALVQAVDVSGFGGGATPIGTPSYTGGITLKRRSRKHLGARA